VIATSGVSSLLDIIAFNICDPGEGILIAVPCFSLYEHHLCSRAGISLIPVPVSFPRTPHFTDTFKSEYEEAAKKGVKVKAVLICNPSNPVGRFYSNQALKEIAEFCGERGLHLVSDEIFAMSCFDNEEEGGLDTFTSVLSIPDDVEKNVRKENIHALYGASKDFGMGGLRLGFLVSRNEVLKETCRKIK
jgi:aspartate/methionine/tyrosine aminotransferase